MNTDPRLREDKLSRILFCLLTPVPEYFLFPSHIHKNSMGKQVGLFTKAKIKNVPFSSGIIY
jgi:hypothetical protein